MNTTDILHIRLHNQLLAGSHLKEPQEVIAYMGAMQAQAYEMAKWGIGLRLPGATNKSVEEAVNEGKIIRTHILRPTWHFVAAEDIHWMLELSAPRIKPMFVNYGKMNGVDEETIIKNVRLLAGILEKYGHLTKQEIEEHLKAEGYDTARYETSYILSCAEQEGIVCNGVVRGAKQTYALLHERVPKTHSLVKEEALERLARKFFTSHGPATLDDYVWWSGLLVSDARKSMELIKDDFISEEIDGKSYWMKNNIQIPSIETNLALLLPAFDEYVVSYKDRSNMVNPEHWKPISKNGMFAPTLHLNGKMLGHWRKVNKKNKIEIELTFFEKTPQKQQNLFKEYIQRCTAFYGK